MTTGSQEHPSELIDAKIASLGGWRGETLSRARALIREAEPGIVEQVKWRKPSNPAGVPVWEADGIVCQRRRAAGPGEAVQFEPGGQHPPGDRPLRGRCDRRGGVQGAGSRCGGVEQGEAEVAFAWH